MRLNDSKNKRMIIMEQISMRQRSREKQRKSSAQRRRKIQQSLNDFAKTMSNVSFRHTGNSQGFHYQGPYSQIEGSQQELQRPKISGKQSLKQQYDEALRSPSFKDINISRDKQPKAQISQESIREPHFGSILQQQKQDDKQQKPQNKILEQEINFSTKRDDLKQAIQKLTPNSIVQNESSASAIFFTSQFNEFISKNHLSSRQNIENQKQQQNQLTFGNNRSNKNFSQSISQLKDSQQNHQSPKKGSPSKIEDHFAQGSNRIVEVNNEINPVPQTLNEQERKQTLIKNKSGHSLAFSNQSSLKYSLNESNIKEILNKKFANQLIADTHQFDPSNQGSQLYYHLKFQIIADKNLQAHKKLFFKELTLLNKVVNFSRKVEKRQKRRFFQAFIINLQLAFQQKVSQIKCDKFLQEIQQKRLRNLFNQFKNVCFTLPKFKVEKAQRMDERKQKQMKQKIFRCLKIAWFDQKVKKQIELYYLSKLFAHFTRVIKAEKQKARNKCLLFYCSNLKKRYFKHMKQGINNLQTQRMEKDNATWHYSFGLQRKIFNAWKDRLSYKDRYISLAMTTKDTFKETKDQKWLQIKTVDFKQIKYQ